MPDTISKPLAWSAFDYIFSETDWRLRVQSLNPLSFYVDHDDAFGACLSAVGAWQSKYQARFWIAARVLELASSYNKTFTRRLSLQLPEETEGPIAEALLSNLERRIRDTVLDDLVAHFDKSIPEWERNIQIEIALLDDPDLRWHASRYVGLDQLVSTDAARKAIRFIIHRAHWNLTEKNNLTVLDPDWRFEQVRAQRSALQEATRARSLVARCVEALVNEHNHEQKTGVDVAPLTRLRVKAEIERLLAEKGVWGLVDLVLPRDRSRHYLRAPEGIGEALQELLAKQDNRLRVRAR